MNREIIAKNFVEMIRSLFEKNGLPFGVIDPQQLVRNIVKSRNAKVRFPFNRCKEASFMTTYDNNEIIQFA